MEAPRVSAADVVSAFERVADLLTAQGAEPRRVQAYRRAARAIDGVGASLGALWEEGGLAALEALPGMLPATALAAEELLHTGRLGLLERLEGEVSPVEVFASVPGIGTKIAHELHELLGLDTLEELEVAAHDGRLERLPGIGPRRAEAIRAALHQLLARSTRRRSRARARAACVGDAASPPAPPVGEILEVDRRYRTLAAQGRLKTIAPRRFNPDRASWLPVMHLDLGGRHYHALYSNTGRAHRLGKTRDWVLVFYDHEGHEDQCTVVTEYEGALRGERVIRGREAECQTYYQEQAAQMPVTLEVLATQPP